ncbi:MAG: hypothetical protein MJA29_06155, partial [Candidatus Omnitrophica bacterium]|nr:hypothetical protein [Candidatus Omnitrophota bacterium]
MKLRPSVVQFTKVAGGNFKVKWANADAYAPQEVDATPAEAEQLAGGPEVQGIEQGQSMTVGESDAERSLEEPQDVEINEFGPYNVMIQETNDITTGHVFPIVDYDGGDMPLFLFTDGQSYSLQDSMVGNRVQEEVPPPQPSEPQGKGAFVYFRQDGSAVALPPVTVQNSGSGPEGTQGYQVETAFGEPMTLVPTPGLTGIKQISEDTVAIPAEMAFIPLGEAVHVRAAMEETENVKEARVISNRVYIRFTGSEYHLDGEPLQKLAQDKRQFLSRRDAEFLLVAAGLDQFEAREKLASARKGGLVLTHADGLRTITPLAHVHAGAVKEARAFLGNFPTDIVKDTVKIASAL